MNDVYRLHVFPRLAATWLPALQLSKTCQALRQWGGARGARRLRIRRSMFRDAAVPGGTRWFVSQPRPLAPPLDMPWSIPAAYREPPPPPPAAAAPASEPAAAAAAAPAAPAAVAVAVPATIVRSFGSRFIYYNGLAWEMYLCINAYTAKLNAATFNLGPIVPAALCGMVGDRLRNAFVSPGHVNVIMHGRSRAADGTAGGKKSYHITYRPVRDMARVGRAQLLAHVVPLLGLPRAAHAAGGQPAAAGQAAAAVPAQAAPPQAAVEAATAAASGTAAAPPWSLHLHEDGRMHGWLRVRFVATRWHGRKQQQQQG